MCVCAPGFLNARWGQLDSAQLRMSAGQGLNRTRARRRASRGHINIARGICHRAAPSPAERPSRCAGRPIWPGANAHGRSCRALRGSLSCRRRLARASRRRGGSLSIRRSLLQAPSPALRVRRGLLYCARGWGSGVLLDRLETRSVNTMLRNLLALLTGPFSPPWPGAGHSAAPGSPSPCAPSHAIALAGRCSDRLAAYEAPVAPAWALRVMHPV